MRGCLQRLANCVFGVVLVAVVGLLLVYYLVLPRLDEMLADAVRREFMLPPSSTVGITRGSLLDTLEGEVKHFHVQSSEAKISGLLVEDIEFRAEGIRFDLPQTLISGQAELLEVAQGELVFRVDEQALEDRWAADLRKRGLTDVQVELTDDQVAVNSVLDLKLTKVRVGASGELYVDGTDRIRFKVRELELGGANVGVEELKAVFSAMTPVIDLGQFKMSVAIDDVGMRDGYLYVQARSMSLEEKLAREQAEEEDVEADADDDAAGTRIRIPTLDELRSLFLEEASDTEDEDTADGEEDQDGLAATEDGDTASEDGEDHAAEDGEAGGADRPAED